jgi:hypothetical protein
MSAALRPALLLLLTSACLGAPAVAGAVPAAQVPAVEAVDLVDEVTEDVVADDEAGDDDVTSYEDECDADGPAARVRAAEDDGADEAEDAAAGEDDDAAVAEADAADEDADASGDADDEDVAGEDDCRAVATPAKPSTLEAVLRRGSLDADTLVVRGRGTVKVQVKLSGRVPKALRRYRKAVLATAIRPARATGRVTVTCKLTADGKRVLRAAGSQVRLKLSATLVTAGHRKSAGTHTVVLRRAKR